MELPVLELDTLVPFPGMTVLFSLSGVADSEVIDRVTAGGDLRFLAAVTGGRPAARLPRYATEMRVLGIETGPAGGITVTAYGHDRHLLDSVRSETIRLPDGRRTVLHAAREHPSPAARADPNEERVAAWDAVSVFIRYLRRFSSRWEQHELRAALPADPFLVASYICANSKLKTARKFRLLCARSLIERLRLTRSMLLRELGESGLPLPGRGLTS